MAEYIKTIWADNVAPATDAEHLNKIEVGIYNAQNDIDVHKTSSDHDSRYYTETELSSTTDGSSGADKIGATTVGSLVGNTVQTIMEKINDSIVGVTQGAVALGSISTNYLANLAVTKDKLDATLQAEIYTPTTSTKTEITQQALYLPSTAIKGELAATLKGNTDVNPIINGNFVDGSNWAPSSGAESVANNTYTLTGDGSASYAHAYQNTSSPCTASKKIYLRALVRVTNANCQSIELHLMGNTGGLYTAKSQASPTINKWYLLTGVAIDDGSLSGNYRVRVIQYYADSATQNGKVMEIKEVMAIDLTTKYGAGNEPTVSQCDSRYAKWFSSVKDTNFQRIKSVGKNGFDKKRKDGLLSTSTSYVENDTGITVSNTASEPYKRVRFLLKLVPDTAYVLYATISATSGTAMMYALDENIGDWYAGAYRTNTGAITFTTNKQGTVTLYFYSAWDAGIGNVSFTNIQLEKGSTATTYEEYTETSVYSLPTLKSISSTIFDKIDLNVGINTKVISDWVTLSGNAFTWAFDGDYTGLKLIYVSGSSFPLAKASVDPLVVKYNNGKQLTRDVPVASTYDVSDMDASKAFEISIADTDSGWLEAWTTGTSFTGMAWGGLTKAYMNGWKLTTANVDVASCVWTGITSGTTKTGSSGYTDVTTTIDVGFTPYKMIYQLATPIITNYYPQVLHAEPSGSVIIEPCIRDAGVYGANIAIYNTSYSISSLDYVSKVTLVENDVVLTPIALSACTVAAGGLTFTVSGGVIGDVYEYAYIYNALSTIPTFEYVYNTNFKAQGNSNTVEIAKLDDKIELINEYLYNQIKTSSLTIGTVSATTNYIAFVAPVNCILNKLSIVSATAITANDTNYWQFDLIDKGSDGSATNTIVTKTTKVTGGTAITAYDAYNCGALDSTHRVLAQGDVVLLTITKASSPSNLTESIAIIEYIPQ